MIGEWEFDYSIIPGKDENLTYHPAWSFGSPLRATTTEIHKGRLPASGSFIHVDNPSFVISSVKETEDGRGWIVRGYNISARQISVMLKPWRKFKKADQANMAEKSVGSIKVGIFGEVTIKMRGHEVATILFQD